MARTTGRTGGSGKKKTKKRVGSIAKTVGVFERAALQKAKLKNKGGRPSAKDIEAARKSLKRKYGKKL